MTQSIRSLVLLLGAGCTTSSSPPQPTRAVPVVLVSLDGFRWDYIQREPAANLRALAGRGIQARRMEPVFPTKTFPNHYTLVTGLHPDHHGIISNTMEDEVLGRFTIGNPDAVRNPAWWGGEPIWVTAQRQGRRAAAYFWPGSEAPIGGMLPTWTTTFDDTVPHPIRIRAVLDWLRLPADSVPAFIALYFSEVDGAGHRFGPDAPETDSAIALVDRSVGALWRGIEQLGLAGRVNLLVTADHGMVETGPDRVILLDDHLDPGSYHVVDWSPVAMIRPAVGRNEEVYRRLSRVPHLSVYRKGEAPPRLHFNRNPRIPAIVAIAEPGWSITDRAGRFRYASTGGAHGYDNRAPEMGALFLGLGPGLAKGKVVDRVRSVDVYALMTHLLGLTPATNDGSLDSIGGVLRP